MVSLIGHKWNTLNSQAHPPQILAPPPLLLWFPMSLKFGLNQILVPLNICFKVKLEVVSHTSFSGLCDLSCSSKCQVAPPPHARSDYMANNMGH